MNNQIALIGAGGSAKSYLAQFEDCTNHHVFDSFGNGWLGSYQVHGLDKIKLSDFKHVVIAIYHYQEILSLLPDLSDSKVSWFNGRTNELVELTDVYRDKDELFLTTNEKLTVIYDLRIAPPTFDFLIFLVKCKLVANQQNLASLHVIVCPGDKNGFRSNIDFFSLQEMNYRMVNLLVPLISLVDSQASFTIGCSRREARRMYHNAVYQFPSNHDFNAPKACHFFYELFDHMGNNSAHQILSSGSLYKDKVREWARSHDINLHKSVVITLRESQAHDERNSDIEQWREAAKKFIEKGVSVILIRDTHNAMIPIYWHGVANFSQLALNVHLRLALYEQSLVNISVSNGAGSLCSLSSQSNYIFFGMRNEQCTATTLSHLEKIGIYADQDQRKGASQGQYISWLDVTAENIVYETEKYFGELLK